jgi:hypothetical protein
VGLPGPVDPPPYFAQEKKANLQVSEGLHEEAISQELALILKCEEINN